MIGGLQISIRGEELRDRVAERIRAHEAATSALDARITQREGDLQFDVRPEDGFETLGELERERQHHRDRVSQLTLLRDHLVAGELYALSSADLRVADLISPGSTEASAGIPPDECVDDRTHAAIDGLKLTIPGEELRRLLERRMQDHRQRADWWRLQQSRTPEQQSEDEPLLPDHM